MTRYSIRTLCLYLTDEKMGKLLLLSFGIEQDVSAETQSQTCLTSHRRLRAMLPNAV